MSFPARAALAPIALLALLGAGAGPAAAADVERGGELYLRTGRAPLSCGDNGACHGPDPRLNLLRIRRGANDAARIESAIAGNRGGMGFLAAHVDSRDVADIAAWIGAVVDGRIDPTVASGPTGPGAGSPDTGAPAGAPTDEIAIASPASYSHQEEQCRRAHG